MDRNYVSEFTLFMNQYLEQHPEVVMDQQRRWNLNWYPEVDLAALREAEEDRATDDAYGFGWLTWRAKPDRVKPH
jgi:hypothetical protein